MFSPRLLVFRSEILNDDALAKIRAGAWDQGSEPTALVSTTIAEYLAFLNEQARLGRHEWGIDLVILRSHLHSGIATAHLLDSYKVADMGATAHICLEQGRYVSVPRADMSMLEYVYQARVVATSDRVLARAIGHTVRVDVHVDTSLRVRLTLRIGMAMTASAVGTPLQRLRPSFSAHGVRRTRAEASRSQLSFDEQLEHLCPPTTVSEWVPSRVVVNADGATAHVPCEARILTRELARVLMPHLLPDECAKPRVSLPKDHHYNSRFAAWEVRYRAAALRLGLDPPQHDLALLEDHSPPPTQPIRFSIAHVACCMPIDRSHDEVRVLVTCFGRRLVLLSDRLSSVTRGTLLAAKAARARQVAPLYGRRWERATALPSLPLPYALLHQHYVSSNGRQTSGSGSGGAVRVHVHAMAAMFSRKLQKDPAVRNMCFSPGWLHKTFSRLPTQFGPSHYIRVPAPSRPAQARAGCDLIFVASTLDKDIVRLGHPVTRGLELVGEALLRAVSDVVPCKGSFECNTSPMGLVVQRMMEQGVPVRHLAVVARCFHAVVMDCLFGRRLLPRAGELPRTEERYLHQCVEATSLQSSSAHVLCPLRISPSVGYDIRYRAHTFSFSHGLTTAEYPPVDPSGNVQRWGLTNGALYSCPADLLVSHMRATGRRHLAGLVETATGVPQRAAATALTVDACGARPVHFQDVLNVVVSTWVCIGAQNAGMLLACCGQRIGEVCRSLWASHMDYSRTPHIDLGCDYRVMSALHSNAKWVETRFARGVLSRVQPGAICRAWCPRPSVSVPASKFPHYSYISGVVYDRSFQRLYDRFTSCILPGMPRDYVTNLVAHPTSVPGRWHSSDVEKVYMSIYQAHHATVESWRASQHRGAHNVVGFILSPLPPGFTPPSGPPLNPRRQTLMDASRWTSDERVGHAAVVLQCHARRYLRRGYIGRAKAFRSLSNHVALLAGRDLCVPYGLYAFNIAVVAWAPHPRPRFVGYAAALCLQVRWRAWLSDEVRPVQHSMPGSLLVPAPLVTEACQDHATISIQCVARGYLSRVRCSRSWAHRMVQRVIEQVLHARSRCCMRWCALRATWILLRCLLASRRRSLAKITRTGRTYAIQTAAEVGPVAVPRGFSIDALISCASVLLTGTRLRIRQVPRDGSCLLHAFAASVPGATASDARVAVVAWLHRRMMEELGFAADVAASLFGMRAFSAISSSVRTTALALGDDPADSALVTAFANAYAAYVSLASTYCDEYELSALSCIYNVDVRVLRVVCPAPASLDGASLVQWSSYTVASATSSVAVLYTQEHYDAVLRVRPWAILRSLWLLARLLCAVRLRHLYAGVSPLASAPPISFVGGGSQSQVTNQIARAPRAPLESPQEARARQRAERSRTAPERASTQAKEQHQLEQVLQLSAPTAAQEDRERTEDRDLVEVLRVSAVEHEQRQGLQQASAATRIQLSFRSFVSPSRRAPEREHSTVLIHAADGARSRAQEETENNRRILSIWHEEEADTEAGQTALALLERQVHSRVPRMIPIFRALCFISRLIHAARRRILAPDFREAVRLLPVTHSPPQGVVLKLVVGPLGVVVATARARVDIWAGGALRRTPEASYVGHALTATHIPEGHTVSLSVWVPAHLHTHSLSYYIFALSPVLEEAGLCIAQRVVASIYPYLPTESQHISRTSCSYTNRTGSDVHIAAGTPCVRISGSIWTYVGVCPGDAQAVCDARFVPSGTPGTQSEMVEFMWDDTVQDVLSRHYWTILHAAAREGTVQVWVSEYVLRLAGGPFLWDAERMLSDIVLPQYCDAFADLGFVAFDLWSRHDAICAIQRVSVTLGRIPAASFAAACPTLARFDSDDPLINAHEPLMLTRRAYLATRIQLQYRRSLQRRADATRKIRGYMCARFAYRELRLSLQRRMESQADPQPLFFSSFKSKGTGLRWMLSNMARAPFTASEADGEMWYEHVEQYMQYHKARIFEDESTAAAILEEANPMAVRKLGRMVVGFDEDMWSRFREGVVEDGCFHKFSQHTDLQAFLLSTGDIELVEASPYDRTWGIGFSWRDAPSKPREMWGQNLLGKVLMRVRRRLRLVQGIREHATRSPRVIPQATEPEKAQAPERSRHDSRFEWVHPLPNKTVVKYGSEMSIHRDVSGADTGWGFLEEGDELDTGARDAHALIKGRFRYKKHSPDSDSDSDYDPDEISAAAGYDREGGRVHEMFEYKAEWHFANYPNYPDELEQEIADECFLINAKLRWRVKAVTRIQASFRSSSSRRYAAAYRIQACFLRFFSRQCRRQQNAPTIQLTPSDATGEPVQGARSIHIVELFCNSCGVGGLINDAGSCELCMRTATAIPTPSTAAGYLTYNVDEPRS